MNDQNLVADEPKDIEASPSRFDHMVHLPQDDSGRQAVLEELLEMSRQVISRRSQQANLAAPDQVSAVNHQFLQSESQIGAKIFGALRADQERSFFCLNETTWIWYESWYDVATRGVVKQTTRYELSLDGVLKSGQGVDYNFIDGHELENFYNAVKVYLVVTGRELYQQ